MSASPGPLSKPPRDYFPWIYRILFVLAVPSVAAWMAHKPLPPKPQISLPILYREVSAYHVLILNDISLKRIDKSDVPIDAVLKMQDLVGHYTLATIKAGQPIREGQIGPKPDPRLISSTLAVAISANNTTTLGGSLRAGDVVSLAAIPLSNTTATPTIVLDAVLVLDVKVVGSQTSIILAIPTNRWLDFLAKTINATVVLARQVE